MPEGFDIKKALDFSLPTMGKVISVGLKFLIIMGVISLIVWSIYVTVVRPHTKPNPTTTQHAEQIINYTIEPRQTFFGCVDFRILKDKINANQAKDKNDTAGK